MVLCQMLKFKLTTLIWFNGVLVALIVAVVVSVLRADGEGEQQHEQEEAAHMVSLGFRS